MLTLANEMQFIILITQTKLFPREQQVIECIVRVGSIKGVGKPEPSLLKRENINSGIMKIGIQLATLTDQRAATIQMRPYRLHDILYPHIRKVILNHEFQVLVDTENSNRIQIRQYISNLFLMLPAREGMVIERITSKFS